MIHANGHLICAIDTETTGLSFEKHDIIEIAVVVLDFDLNPDPNYLPFHMELQPAKDFEDIDFGFISKSKIDRLEAEGFNPLTALDIFIEWLDKLNLPTGVKRIMPLAHNWNFDKMFIERWMGPASYNLYFDGRARDLLPISLFINDCDDFHNQRYHFPKSKLSYICNQLGIECDPDMFHNAVYDAVKTAEAYKRLCQLTQCFH